MNPHESFGISDIGLKRSNNEDVWNALADQQFFILADGVGGHNAGEVASQFATKSMCASMSAHSTQASVEEACRLLRKAVHTANQTVLQKAQETASCKGMGTTLSCFVLLENHLVYAHVGDSRLYRFRQKLHKLTRDHSTKQITDGKVRIMITRAVGNQATIHPDLGVIPLCSNDVYMLCSDGLSDYVPEETLSKILGSPLPLKEMGKKLIKAALEKGGNDNITLLLVRVKPGTHLSKIFR